MKYMLLIYGTEEGWTEQETQACLEKSMAICDELASQGKLASASPLHPVSAATSVRIRDGRRQITDGPFAETTEQLGGYYLLDVENLDEAIAIASRIPPVHKGTVEIRPLFPLPGRQSVEPEVFRRELQIAASAGDVYTALTTQRGIEGWWTSSCIVAAERGGAVMVRFGQTYKIFRVEQLVPARSVQWKCVEARLEVPGHSMKPDEWVGTAIEFSIQPDGPAASRLTLSHVGLGPRFDCFEVCASGWGHFLESLKQYCEAGVGTPFGGAQSCPQPIGK